MLVHEYYRSTHIFIIFLHEGVQVGQKDVQSILKGREGVRLPSVASDVLVRGWRVTTERCNSTVLRHMLVSIKLFHTQNVMVIPSGD